MLQEYSRHQRKLIGERQNIFAGTALGFTEAPHLYKRNGYYYLVTAEGGTGWGHAVTMARSRSLTGPYELHPDMYIITARDRPDAPLQRAGHGDLVETQTGETYMVYLAGGRCPTAAAACSAAKPRSRRWSGAAMTGCARAMAAVFPQLETPAPDSAAPRDSRAAPIREDFDGEQLPIDFQWLRSPLPEEFSA